MELNFRFHDFCYAIFEGTRYDLHNCYVAEYIGMKPDGAVFELRFRRNPHYAHLSHCSAETISVRCSGNVAVRFNDLVDVPGDIRSASFDVGYFDEHCDWDALLDDRLAEKQGFVGLHFDFSAGPTLRVIADKAEMSIC